MGKYLDKKVKLYYIKRWRNGSSLKLLGSELMNNNLFKLATGIPRKDKKL